MGSDDEDELAELRAARAARTGQTTLVSRGLLLMCNLFYSCCSQGVHQPMSQMLCSRTSNVEWALWMMLARLVKGGCSSNGQPRYSSSSTHT